MGRIGDELAVDAGDADSAERACPRDVADDERGAGADDAENIGIIFLIRAEENGLDLDLIEQTLGKERADGPIGEASGEDFLFGRTAFALEITSGKFPGGG